MEKKAVKELTNQRPAENHEHYGTLIRSEGHLGEFAVPI